MFSRILISALFAGAAAGGIAALLQLVFVQPVLLHAELYESGELIHFGSTATVPVAQDLVGLDILRDGLSVLFTMLTYTGYGLLLIAGMALAESNGAAINGRTGLIWGVGGFVAFHLAPGLGLPPEVPGVAAADVAARQIWWFATVISTAGALWLIAFSRVWVIWAVAICLLLAPHLVGAPGPDYFSGPVPTEIAALFAARAFGVGLAAWVLLGGFAGFFWQREGEHALATGSA